jgi:hypothetical protein
VQVDEELPVGEPVDQTVADVDRERALPDPAHPVDRGDHHRTGAAYAAGQGEKLLDFTGAPGEGPRVAGQLLGVPVGSHAGRKWNGRGSSEHGRGRAGGSREKERRVGVEDSAVQLPAGRGRFGTQLLRCCPGQGPERLHRLGLPAVPVQGEHQLRVERLVERVGCRQRAQFADHLAVAPEVQVGFDPSLDRLETGLVQVVNLRVLRQRGHVREGVPAPQFQCRGVVD